MSRPLRIVEPGLWHHVMHRGVDRRAIVEHDADRGKFFELVADCGSRFGVWTCSACLMDNHYHLLLYDETGRLSRAMRHLDGVFTQTYNRRHHRDGALFRGRYASRVVEQERYLFEVVRYIHANPVDAGLVEQAGDYPWSSHRCYVLDEAAPWLRKDLLLELIGEGPDRMRWFDRYVHERVAPEMRQLLAPPRWSPVLGSEEFVLSIRQRLRADGTVGEPEIPEARRLAALTPEEVLSTACRVFEISREQLVQGRRGSLNRPRLVTLLMCRDHTPAKADELAAIFGVRRPTVAVLAADAREIMGHDVHAAQAWQSLRGALAEAGQLSS